MTPVRTEQVARLRAQIAALETRPILAETAGHKAAGPDVGALPGGLLHEVFSPSRRDGGAALGFALAEALPLLSARRPAVVYLALGAEGQEIGLPYGPGLAGFGFDPEALVLGQVGSMSELLWAMEEAVACKAVAAVMADLARDRKEMDFTASRRLSLRAVEAGTSIFVLRYGSEREASAAHYRWRVEAEASGAAPYDARAPGQPRWRVTLEKGHLGRLSAGRSSFVFDWTGHELDPIDQPDRADRPHRRTALPGAQPAALGNRLSQAG